MKVCPRCGTRRRATAKLVLPEPEPSPPERTTGSLLLPEVLTGRSPSADLPVPSPLFTPDEERRFPRFTSAQWTLLVLGLLLLVVGLVIAWLLWRQQQLDERRLSLAQAAEVAQVEGQQSAPTPPPPILSPASATPEASAGEASLDEAVVATLRAYNPFGYTRYRVGVRDGVVTLEGVAEHLPERAGAENVVRLVSGVKAVVNRLRVRSEEASEPLLRFDRAEAALLEEAARQQRARTATEAASANPPNQEVMANQEVTAPLAVPADPASFARETERLRRELALARERAQETARRQQAEDRRQRELEETLRPQPAPAGPAGLPPSQGAPAEVGPRQALLRERPGVAPPPVLASGTVAWSGLVDGADEVLFTGAAATVRHLAGSPAREVRASFSAPLPLEPVAVRLLTTDGRGPITIVQQPAAENGFTTIVRLDDRQRGGAGRYQFTLRWSREAR